MKQSFRCTSFAADRSSLSPRSGSSDRLVPQNAQLSVPAPLGMRDETINDRLAFQQLTRAALRSATRRRRATRNRLKYMCRYRVCFEISFEHMHVRV